MSQHVMFSQRKEYHGASYFYGHTLCSHRKNIVCVSMDCVSKGVCAVVNWNFGVGSEMYLLVSIRDAEVKQKKGIMAFLRVYVCVCCRPLIVEGHVMSNSLQLLTKLYEVFVFCQFVIVLHFLEFTFNKPVLEPKVWSFSSCKKAKFIVLQSLSTFYLFLFLELAGFPVDALCQLSAVKYCFPKLWPVGKSVVASNWFRPASPITLHCSQTATDLQRM